MDFILTLALALAISAMLKARQQHQRIALLAGFLAPYSLEKHIETVTHGYMRALGEDDPNRREQIWQLLQPSEQALCRQVTQLADDVAAADPAHLRVSKWPIWLPFAIAGAFDLRDALRVHARGICQAVEADGTTSPRDRAYTILAELLLMQHTCHWFCRSKVVASARMLAAHQTSYEKLVASVLPQTRSAYLNLVSLSGRA